MKMFEHKRIIAEQINKQENWKQPKCLWPVPPELLCPGNPMWTLWKAAQTYRNVYEITWGKAREPKNFRYPLQWEKGKWLLCPGSTILRTWLLPLFGLKTVPFWQIERQRTKKRDQVKTKAGASLAEFWRSNNSISSSDVSLLLLFCC